MADECYSHFIYDGGKPCSIAGNEGARKPHVIVAGSLSKTYAMTGWRAGFALAPKPVIDAMTRLQSQSTSNPTSITQKAALAAVTSPMDSVTAMLAEYAKRRARILAGLNAIPGITCASPQGAFLYVPQCIENTSAGQAVLPIPVRSPKNFWRRRTLRSLPEMHLARPDICASPTPPAWSGSKKVCVAWSDFSPRPQQHREKRISVAPFASGTDFRAANLGRCISCASVSGKKIAS